MDDQTDTRNEAIEQLENIEQSYREIERDPEVDEDSRRGGLAESCEQHE